MLQRFTTEYVETEDRLRLTGETATGDTLILWLTQRLLGRLLPHLFVWLAQQTGEDLRGDLLQEFAQQSALNALEPQVAVQAQPAAREWLVQSVDITSGDEALRLTFKAPSGDSGTAVSLMTARQPLRQWLHIVHEQYRKAQWPLTQWPEWMADARTSLQANSAVVH